MARCGSLPCVVRTLPCALSLACTIEMSGDLDPTVSVDTLDTSSTSAEVDASAGSTSAATSSSSGADDDSTGGSEGSTDTAVDDTDDPAESTGGDVGDAVFHNGWENLDELGCSLNGLLDGPGGPNTDSWNDFGPALATTCGDPIIAEIVDDEHRGGARSLRVNFYPDGSGNGPDFRIGQDLPSLTETYARASVKYSDNWVWAGADHKILIFGQGGDQPTQDIYINVRGMGDGGAGFIAVHSIPADTVFEAHASNVAPGVWHLVEAHVVSGVHGSIEVRLDGELLDLVDQGPNGFDPADVETGVAIEYVKIDTTYNLYAYPSSLGLTMATWFDDVAVFAGSW